MSITQKIFGVQNAKTVKGEALKWRTLIRYLAPATESGTNVCPNAGACAAVCLYTAGRGSFAATKAARVAKTLDAVRNRAEHLARAAEEIRRELARLPAGWNLAVRMNGTSDLPADARQLAMIFANENRVKFYDYTKIADAIFCPGNVHYTLSHDPISVPWEACAIALAGRTNVAVVFDRVPATYKGYTVIDGDQHDLRFLDPRGVIVGLKAKGAARKANSFVVRCSP